MAKPSKYFNPTPETLAAEGVSLLANQRRPLTNAEATRLHQRITTHGEFGAEDLLEKTLALRNGSRG